MYNFLVTYSYENFGKQKIGAIDVQMEKKPCYHNFSKIKKEVYKRICLPKIDIDIIGITFLECKCHE